MKAIGTIDVPLDSVLMYKLFIYAFDAISLFTLYKWNTIFLYCHTNSNKLKCNISIHNHS